MRTIKFRAWDKKRKVMIGSDYPDNHYEESYSEWWGIVEQMELESIEDIYKDKDFKVMQYTGIDDKYRTHIYESDIVDFDGEAKIVFIGLFTVWIDGLGSQEFYGVHIKVKDDYGNIIGWPVNNQMIVVGNTYQNSNLLEAQDETES